MVISVLDGSGDEGNCHGMGNKGGSVVFRCLIFPYRLVWKTSGNGVFIQENDTLSEELIICFFFFANILVDIP